MKYKPTYQTQICDVKYFILSKLYFGNAIFRKLFYIYISKKEGGQFYSITLRRIFKEAYDIEAGIGTYGCFTTNFRPHVRIGNYSSIAPGVQRLVGNHPFNGVSMHPIFYDPSFGCVETSKYQHHVLEIGHGVWIGVNAIITGNCEYIGNGAVIGAGAVVTHDVPPYAVFAGCPAKIIKYRLSEEDIKLVESSKWWEYTPDQLKCYADMAFDVQNFVNQLKR